MITLDISFHLVYIVITIYYVKWVSAMKLGVIGVGNMAGAIVESVLNNQIFKAEDIILYDIFTEKLSAFTNRGLSVAGSPSELVEAADLILLAVKPQQIDDVLSVLAGLTDNKCIVSIVTGVSSEYMKKQLGGNTYIVSVMPNTPIMLGCGASAISKNNGIPAEYYEKAVSLFSCSGEVALIDEDKLNAVTGVNGSSPAYFFTIAGAMAKAAEEQGIDPELALKLTAKSMEGAALMLLKSGKTPSELTAQVTSKGGTTFAALAEMERLGLPEAIRSGMLACTKRAFEIGR
jgi:pyrroline-5-carboxylate reductase